MPTTVPQQLIDPVLLAQIQDLLGRVAVLEDVSQTPGPTPAPAPAPSPTPAPAPTVVTPYLDTTTMAAAKLAAAQAAAGGYRAAFWTKVGTELGANPKCKVISDGTKVYEAAFVGTLAPTGASLTLPTTTGASSTNTATTIASHNCTLLIEKAADATRVLMLSLGRSGKDANANADLDGTKQLEFALTVDLDPALDVVPGESIPESDAGTLVYVVPSKNLIEAADYDALSQVSTFPNPSFSTLTEPGVIGAGNQYTFSRVTDPADPSKKAFRHFLAPNFPVWAPSYVASGALDPTWRSEIAIGTEAHSPANGGGAVIIGIRRMFGADLVAGGSASIFDAHAPDGDQNIGPGPLSLLVGSGNMRLYRAYNTTLDGSSSNGKVLDWFDYTYVAGVWYDIIFEVKFDWNVSNSPYLRMHVAVDGGPVTKVYDSASPVQPGAAANLIGYRHSGSFSTGYKLKSGLYAFYSFTGTMTSHGKGILCWLTATGASKTVAGMLASLRAQ